MNRLSILCAALLLGGAAFAYPAHPITLTIDTSEPGPTIPEDFVGISVSSQSIAGNSGYIRYFVPENRQMVSLFRQIGIKHLRTIMGKADPKDTDPSPGQVDSFFDFAAAAGVKKVIWSLHLMNAGGEASRWSNNRAVAAHIWNTTTANGTVERDLLDSFAFDNEPDWLRYICCADPVIKGYDSPAGKAYVDAWEEWRGRIGAPDVAPGARFSGPDTGSIWPCAGDVNTAIRGVPFTRRFATDKRASLSLVSQHFYGDHPGTNSTLWMAQQCLSANWLTNRYEVIYEKIIQGLPAPFRFTECSPFVNQRNRGNQCFATALWAVDFYHWWARRGCAGVNPFTRCAQYNAPIYFDGTNYLAEPYAYGMKTFQLGSRGNSIPASRITVDNPGNINMTAYGVVNSTDLFVTIVNKTFDSAGSHTAEVNIPAPRGFKVKHARYLVLSGGANPGSAGNATMSGACLGGARIPNDGSPWAGTWTSLTVTGSGVSLPVLPTTAVIVDLQNH